MSHMSGVLIIMGVEWLVWQGWIQTEGHHFKVSFLLKKIFFTRKEHK